MSDLSVPSPIGHDTYVCNGFRAINGVFRHRGELFDATGVRNMDILEEMGLVRRTVPEVPSIDVEYDGMTRRFVNDEYANLFIEWTAQQPDGVEEEAAPAVAEAGEPADDPDSNEEDDGEGEEEAIDYETLTKAQLADLLDEREIEYKAGDNKAKMIQLLVANDEEGDDEEEEEEDGDDQP